MSEPHVCPSCEGTRHKYNARSGQMEECPTCGATGVVWEPSGASEAADRPRDDDALDLTYRK